ncbi:MAG: hypothetical protein IPJ82_18005 [Lewinellaceae bacterium]|nr:hypothetical protein [Lewinellaceae bacterium]
MKSKHLLFFLFFPFFLLAQPKKGTGLVVDMPSLRGTPYKAKLTLKSYKSVPAAASLEKYTPIPGDQGQYSTCVAFATAYHLRTILWAKQNNITDKSKLNEHIFSPTFVYEQIKDDGDNDCQGRQQPDHGLRIAQKPGGLHASDDALQLRRLGGYRCHARRFRFPHQRLPGVVFAGRIRQRYQDQYHQKSLWPKDTR